MKNTFLLVVVVIFSCCDTRKYQAEHISTTHDEIVEEEEHSPDNFDQVRLTDNISALTLGGAQNIGEFYDRRLIFYRIDNPGMKIGNSKVRELVFYFVDSALVKLRYKIRDEVGNQLLDSLGLSAFSPLDDYAVKQIETHNVISKVNGHYKLNANLNNYELIWRRDGNVSKYKASMQADSSHTYYFYHEIDDYTQQLRLLEAYYKHKEKIATIL